MKVFIKKLLPEFLIIFIYQYVVKPFKRDYKRSYAQCGEDMILDVIINKKKGFYIDIGANNPTEQSNTMYFYKKGWRGINIDATPGSMTSFKKLRKNDINLEIAIASEEKEMTYYMFEPSFYNTFDSQSSEQFKDKLVGQKLIKTIRLSQVLDEYANDTDIDFLTVDAEGYDYNILQSNDWENYRPKVVVIEYITYAKKESKELITLRDFLESVGYSLFCNSPTNAFFIENHFFVERFELDRGGLIRNGTLLISKINSI